MSCIIDTPFDYLFSRTSHRAQTIDVEAQPLADNVNRVLRALDELGNPLPADQVAAHHESGERSRT